MYMSYSRTVTATLSLIGIFLLSTPVVWATPQGDWQQIRQRTTQVVLTVSDNDRQNQLFVIDAEDRSAYRQVSPTTWEKVSEPAAQFVQGRALAGSTLYKLTKNKDAVYQYKTRIGWRKVGGPAQQLYGGIGGLYAASPDSGDLMSYDPSSQQWTKIGGPGSAFAVGGKEELYGISVDGKALYRYLGIPGKWEQIGDGTQAIFAAPGYLYRIDTRGRLEQYNGAPMSWTPIGDNGKTFAVTEEADVYGLSESGKGIFQYLGRPGRWIGMNQGAVSIHAQGNELYAVGAYGELLRYTRPTRPEDADLLIIARDEELREAIAEYAEHKRQNGLAVAIVTLEEVMGSEPGFDLANRIRNYLIKAHGVRQSLLKPYRGKQLRYVLLVGDVDTIPTKMLFRDNGNFLGNRPKHNAYSTDFYYANLHTHDWDLDNDGLWGEFADDKLDINHDVVVSRIPFNDAATVSQVSKNFIAFDDARGESWQRRVVLAHGFLNASFDLAKDAEKIVSELLSPNGYSSHKLYVNKAGTKSEYFDSSGAEALSNASYLNALSPQGQGLSLLAAHGSTTGMSSVYLDDSDNQQWIVFGDWWSVQGKALDGIFFLNGCNTAPTLTSNGYPPMQEIEADLNAQGSSWSSIDKPTHGNIAKEYLKSGAVAVIASTVGSEAGSQKMEYELVKRLVVDEEPIGDAFFHAKEAVGPVRAYQTFYLVGDPTLSLR
ncbi:MAG: C25 family cysteine peptidase [Candidatus Thiodiazotropha sp.]